MTSKTKNTLIEKHGGEENYRKHMSDIRKKRIINNGGALRNPEFARKAVNIRWEKERERRISVRVRQDNSSNKKRIDQPNNQA